MLIAPTKPAAEEETFADPRQGRLQLHGYLPGLDVLRGMAVMGVVTFHGLSNSGYAGPAVPMFLANLARVGGLGVSLFFILSGFLITSILLKQRDKPHYYRNFYVRRALRILPALALMLTVLKLFGIISWPFLVACLLFVVNMGKLMHIRPDEYGVFWTLAVEEQFYLLWPTVIRAFRRPRTLLAVLLTGCVLAPLMRIALDLHGISTILLLPTNMDALLYGALCAVLISTGAIHLGNVERIARNLVRIGLVFLLPVVYALCFQHSRTLAMWTFEDAVGRLDPFCFFLAGVLLSVLRAQGPDHAHPAPRARAWVFLGYISYGLYLVHPLIFTAYDRAVAGTALGGTQTHFGLLLLRYLIGASVSILLATLSRRYFEQLFLQRKKRLAPYAHATAEVESLP